MKQPIFNKTGTRDCITHVFIHDQRIILSDSFELDNNEYILLEILKSTDKVIFLKIIGVSGPDMGSRYLVPKDIFEKNTIAEIKHNLHYYKH